MTQHQFLSQSSRAFLLFTILLLIGSTSAVLAQTTQFTYQGKLSDTGTAASGQYDFQFKLFDTQTVGTGVQFGGVVAVPNVTVAGGIFTAQIDFGICATCFNGSARFLEIAVKLTSDTSFTTLGPRQPVTSNPYAIRSLNAGIADGLSVSCLSCVTSSQLQSVQGSQITGAIAGSQLSGLIPVASVPGGSGNYIQNTTVQQTSSNFNISGNGTAAGTLSSNAVNATTQYNLNGSRVLSNTGSLNLFAGVNAGPATTGSENAFFGADAGLDNRTGQANSFFGTRAGRNNTTGIGNSFFGNVAGSSNLTGDHNAIFGSGAGVDSIDGSANTFIGHLAGGNNSHGSNNTYIGDSTGPPSSGPANLLFATAIGANAEVTTSHTIVLGTDQEVVDVPGKLQIDTLGTAGSTNLCLNSSSRVAPCSSSLRYKTDLRPFAGGLSIINRLQPISFSWKDGGMRDVGLGAEDVARIEPLLTFTNSKGEIEGVKYNQLSALFINAFKEQQKQIEEQQIRIKERERQATVQQAQIDRYRDQLAHEQQQIQRQQKELDSLKRIVWLVHRKAKACNARRHIK